MALQICKLVFQGCLRRGSIQSTVTTVRSLQTEPSKSWSFSILPAYIRHTSRLFRKLDGVSSVDRLIYRYAFGLLPPVKLMMTAILPAMLYQAYKEVQNYMATDELTHPSQIVDASRPVMAVGATILLTIFAGMTLVVSRTAIKRVYLNETSGSYRMIVGNYIGNQHIIVTPGEVRFNQDQFFIFNHKVSETVVYLNPQWFEKPVYYKNLIGDVDLEGRDNS